MPPGVETVARADPILIPIGLAAAMSYWLFKLGIVPLNFGR